MGGAGTTGGPSTSGGAVRGDRGSEGGREHGAVHGDGQRADESREVTLAVDSAAVSGFGHWGMRIDSGVE